MSKYQSSVRSSVSSRSCLNAVADLWNSGARAAVREEISLERLTESLGRK